MTVTSPLNLSLMRSPSSTAISSYGLIMKFTPVLSMAIPSGRHSYFGFRVRNMIDADDDFHRTSGSVIRPFPACTGEENSASDGN